MSNDGLIMNSELKKTWNGVAMAAFEILLQYLRGGTEEDCENYRPK
jgi:hypothetical protein